MKNLFLTDLFLFRYIKAKRSFEIYVMEASFGILDLTIWFQVFYSFVYDIYLPKWNGYLLFQVDSPSKIENIFRLYPFT